MDECTRFTVNICFCVVINRDKLDLVALILSRWLGGSWQVLIKLPQLRQVHSIRVFVWVGVFCWFFWRGGGGRSKKRWEKQVSIWCKCTCQIVLQSSGLFWQPMCVNTPFVVETWEQLRFFCLSLCGGCTTRGVPERLVQFGAVHLRLRLLQGAAKLAALQVLYYCYYEKASAKK